MVLQIGNVLQAQELATAEDEELLPGVGHQLHLKAGGQGGKGGQVLGPLAV